MNDTKEPTRIVFALAISTILAAIVCVTTLSFTVSIPATAGYFNIGETVIYVAALVFGPYVGAFAGGFGAALADMLVAFPFFPGTLVVKACEGAIVGFLNRKLKRMTSSKWTIYTAILGILVGISLGITGSIYYSGQVQLARARAQLYIGYPQPASPTFSVFIPAETWYILGTAVALLIIYAGFKIEPQSGCAIFSMIIGGLEMVIGYFLYEQIVLGKAGAIVEVPVNMGQMIIGLIVAMPISRIILRSLPQLKNQ